MVNYLFELLQLAAGMTVEIFRPTERNNQQTNKNTPQQTETLPFHPNASTGANLPGDVAFVRFEDGFDLFPRATQVWRA